jgi:hypothetical protein
MTALFQAVCISASFTSSNTGAISTAQKYNKK